MPLLLAFAVALAVRAPALATALIRLHADSIRFYYDRYLIEADGGVQVTTDDGVSIVGDAFSMDLKLNRFLVAGHVRVDGKTGTVTGAALADFVDFNRIYFVPITSEPDRWTFLNDDFAHPAKGREMPGDTFEFPDTSNATPFLTAAGVTIGARQFMSFRTVRLAALHLPLESFYLNFSQNPNIVQNSLAGATLDLTYEFAGSANANSALHLRYDPSNKTYYSFEQHFATTKAYAAISVNPLSRPQKFYDLNAGARVTPTSQISLFAQESAFQLGLTQPLDAQLTTYLTATQALKHASIQGSFQVTRFALLPPPPNHQGFYGAPEHFWNPQREFFGALGLSSFPKRVGRLPLFYSYRYGVGNQNDPYGLQNYGNVVYTSWWSNYVGTTVYSPGIKLGDHDNPYKVYTLTALFDKQRTTYSLPHALETATTTVGISRLLGSTATASLTYSISHNGDYYKNGQQTAYAPVIPVVNGVSFPGFAAFQGVATLHTLSLNASYAPSPNLAFFMQARQHVDFPRAIPHLVPLPPTNVLGQPLIASYVGQPPYDASLEVRFRILPHYALDIGRTYYFGFGGLRWNPQFVVQVTQ